MHLEVFSLYERDHKLHIPILLLYLILRILHQLMLVLILSIHVHVQLQLYQLLVLWTVRVAEEELVFHVCPSCEALFLKE